MGAVPVLGNALPFEDTSLSSYCEPAVIVMFTAKYLCELAGTFIGVVVRSGLRLVVYLMLFTHNSLIMIGVVPEFWKVALIIPLVPVPV